MGAIGVQWLLLRTGLGATNHFESGGFIRSRAGVLHPDLQYHFLPIAISYDGKDKVDQHGFQAHVGPMRADLARHGDARVGESRAIRRASSSTTSRPKATGRNSAPPSA